VFPERRRCSAAEPSPHPAVSATPSDREGYSKYQKKTFLRRFANRHEEIRAPSAPAQLAAEDPEQRSAAGVKRGSIPPGAGGRDPHPGRDPPIPPGAGGRDPHPGRDPPIPLGAGGRDPHPGRDPPIPPGAGGRDPLPGRDPHPSRSRGEGPPSRQGPPHPSRTREEGPPSRQGRPHPSRSGGEGPLAAETPGGAPPSAPGPL